MGRYDSNSEEARQGDRFEKLFVERCQSSGLDIVRTFMNRENSMVGDAVGNLTGTHFELKTTLDPRYRDSVVISGWGLRVFEGYYVCAPMHDVDDIHVISAADVRRTVVALGQDMFRLVYRDHPRAVAVGFEDFVSWYRKTCLDV